MARQKGRARKTSQKNGTVVGCSLTGLPQEIDQDDLAAFLANLLGSMMSRVTIVQFTPHRKSSSAILHLPHKRSFQLLSVLLQENPLRGRYINVGRHNKDDKLPQTKNESSSSKKQSKKKQTWQEARIIAENFHKYLHGHPDLLQKACDRDAAGIVFRDYYQAECNENGTYNRRLEALVMACMREKRLLKSKRHGDKVVMAFANLDGTFPTIQEQNQAKEQVLRTKQEQEANKHGVIVSDAPEHTIVQVGDTTQTVQFTVHQSSSEFPTVLQKMNVKYHKDYKLWDLAKCPVTLSSSPVAIGKLALTPKRIGVFRASIQCSFYQPDTSTTFEIVRYLSFRSGDKEIDKILEPTAPYEPRKPKFYERAPEETFDPPSVSIPGTNPFEKLPHHSIPLEVTAMMMNHEYGDAITKWPHENGDITVKGYGAFWKSLLWASEYQNYRDIQLFDMKDAKLKRLGRFFSLEVAGLAEGRPSVLRGDLVHVTWNGRLYKGRVQHVRLLEVVLEFHDSFHKSYHPGTDLVDVRFTFSRMTYRTSHEACVKAEKTMKEPMLIPTDNDLTLVGLQKLSRKLPSQWKWANRNLNQEQRTAVAKIVEGSVRPLPYVIFGPPGTGKTTTVVEAVYQLARHSTNMKILLVAPSNDAADILVQRLASYFPPTELRRILAYSRSIESVPIEIRGYVKEGATSEDQLREILSARIVVSTVNLAARFAYYGVPVGHFDVLCVDEGGHATEPEVVSIAASLMNFASNSQVGQMVLAGDPRQLGPIITSELARTFGLSISYMERLMGRDIYGRGQDGKFSSDLLTKLVRNYRSHPAVLKLPNKMFYDNELECCGDMMTTHNLINWEYLPRKGFPVVFHSMEGENLREGNSPSWFNPQEAQQVVQYTKLLLEETRPPLREEEIGIITPYARQAQKIRLALKSQGIINAKVGSVECFQGQERRCIIISTVRAETEQVSSDLRYNLGFVANEKRFNVALTRAKALLIVIGTPKVLAMDKENWLPFLLYCHENNSWLGEHWDANEVEEDSGSERSVDEQQWDLIDAPSKAAEQEAYAFISREE